MPDISLLPDEARKREQQIVPPKKSEVPSGGFKMHIPEAEVDEDIEIIEVDEGDLGTVLADEPLLTRFMYRASAFVDMARRKLFASTEKAPAPKLPPQFFTPPRAGTSRLPPGVSDALASASGMAPSGGKSRARITPSAEVPRRVRVIKRVRKPVQVSLISAEDVLAYRVDIPKRQWTMAVLTLLFMSLIGGGYWLLDVRTASATAALTEISRQLAATDADITRAETTWSDYRDLQRRLTVLGDLLDEHVVVSRLFDLLEQRTLPTVAYRGAALNAQNRVSLDVVASSYSAAAQQLVAFQQSPLIAKAESTSFTAQIDGETGEATLVTFQLTLELNDQLLRGPIANATSTTP